MEVWMGYIIIMIFLSVGFASYFYLKAKDIKPSLDSTTVYYKLFYCDQRLVTDTVRLIKGSKVRFGFGNSNEWELNVSFQPCLVNIEGTSLNEQKALIQKMEDLYGAAFMLHRTKAGDLMIKLYYDRAKEDLHDRPKRIAYDNKGHYIQDVKGNLFSEICDIDEENGYTHQVVVLRFDNNFVLELYHKI